MKKDYIALEESTEKKNRVENNSNSLSELLLMDKGFLSEFANLLMEKAVECTEKEMYDLCQSIYDNDNYLEIIDYIIQKAFDYDCLVELHAPQVFELFIREESNKKHKGKIDKWIRLYISKYNTNSMKMRCLFDVLRELKDRQLKRYLGVFIAYNKDFDVFKQLDLVPSYVIVSRGEKDSLYVKRLQTLLPLFNGKDFSEHRKQITSAIAVCQGNIDQVDITFF